MVLKLDVPSFAFISGIEQAISRSALAQSRPAFRWKIDGLGGRIAAADLDGPMRPTLANKRF